MIVLVFVAKLVCNLGLTSEGTFSISEMHRLENARQSSASFSAGDLRRLAELYFITSQCKELQRIHKTSRHTEGLNDLFCACGIECKTNNAYSTLRELRSLFFDKKRNWEDRQVQKLWRQVQHEPEAIYWAIRALRATPRKTVSTARQLLELERTLQALEVQ